MKIITELLESVKLTHFFIPRDPLGRDWKLTNLLLELDASINKESWIQHNEVSPYMFLFLVHLEGYVVA